MQMITPTLCLYMYLQLIQDISDNHLFVLEYDLNLVLSNLAGRELAGERVRTILKQGKFIKISIEKIYVPTFVTKVELHNKGEVVPLSVLHNSSQLTDRLTLF